MKLFKIDSNHEKNIIIIKKYPDILNKHLKLKWNIHLNKTYIIILFK